MTDLSGFESGDSAACGRWVEAQYLRPGDVLLSRECGPVKVVAVSTRKDAIRVHNLQVEETRTYNVSGLGVLIHNQSHPVPCEIPDHLTSHYDAHTVERHGGSITNEQLETRARTGIAPDGSHLGPPPPNNVIPPISSAFHSDELMVHADDLLRSGPLQAEILAHPSQTVLNVEFDTHIDVGRGYRRIGGAHAPGLQGPLQFIPTMTRVRARLELNAATGIWETITMFPVI